MQFGIHLLGLGRRATVADYITATAVRPVEKLGHCSARVMRSLHFNSL